MSQHFHVHPDNPQPRLLRQAAEILRAGGVAAYPTDSCYALGCHLGDKTATDRIRAIRKLPEDHWLTLVCRDLSEIARYARVDNIQYRLLKSCLPGPYTFVLPASREVPRRLVHPKRLHIGLRIPDHPVVLSLLQELGEPIVSTSLILPGETEPMTAGWAIRDALEHSIDVVIDDGSETAHLSTVVDLTTDIPLIMRQGLGCASRLGLEA
ncbi:MAG: L-threonylcarbamoyladenylate synthase [Burkholderiales bacterium]|jgi:tRNA threonylcarbamoyl adenosine modification protein (Sua5/YciO/YrdC/YwlC family)|nr:threonylcarbamoyl-AMP synthase [Betaproteobacteria bacterium]